MNNLSELFESVNWDNVIDHDNVNKSFDDFCELISRSYCECFPKKTKIISGKSQSKPWITSTLLDLIKKKSNYYKLYKLGYISKEVNNSFKNKVNKEVDKAKNSYYLNCFKNAKNDMKKSWELIHFLAGYQNKSSVNGGEDIELDFQKAEKFNNFFSNIGELVSSETLNANVSNNLTLSKRNPSSFFLFPVTNLEIEKIIVKLKSVKSDLDFLPVKIFIALRGQLVYPIVKLINLSFQKGIYPDQLKLARIVPIYKKQGDISDPSNYRPISCLPYLGKIYERAITNRLINFCSKHSLISKFQFGFQRNKSTCDALINLTEIIYNSLDDKEFNLTILIDLRKAFDLVSHKILLDKMELYGIRGIALDLFKSYLSNRRCFVEIGSTKSNEGKISMGVPQGSIVSPALFLLFINDLPDFSKKFKTTLFADDTTLTLSGKHYGDLVEECNSELNKLVSWTNQNKLQINSKKTELIIFTNKVFTSTNSDVQFCGENLNFGNSCKFLGVSLNNSLRFAQHIGSVVDKISKHTGIFYRIRDKLPLKARFNYYYGFIYPYLSYNVVVWGGTYEIHLKPLIIQHKRFIRTMADAAARDHTSPLFLKFGLLKFSDIYRFNLLQRMFKEIQNGNFSVDHSRFTRNRNLAAPTFHRLSLSQHAFSFSGPSHWNALPNYLRIIPKFRNFKRELKSYLLDQYSENNSNVLHST